MRRTLLILLVLVIFLGGGVFLLNTLGIIHLGGTTTDNGNGTPQPPEGTPTPTNTPITYVPLVIAVQDLPRGIKIPEGALTVVQWPIQTAPQNAVTKVEDVIGRIARTDISIEEPILSTLLVQDLTQIAATGSDGAAAMPATYGAVAIPVDRLSDVAYAPQDGDYVDVVVSFMYVDIDPSFQTILPNKLTLVSISSTGTIAFLGDLSGRIEATNLGVPAVVSPSEKQRPRVVTTRTIVGALVLHTGNFPPNGKYIGIPPTPTPIPAETSGSTPTGPPPPTPTPPYPDVVTLAVKMQDAVTLAWYVQTNTPITLVLRAAKDKGGPDDANATVSLDYIISKYNAAPPTPLRFSVEPAIRSIRQVVSGNQVAFGQ